MTTVSGLLLESLYWQDDVFLVNRGPGKVWSVIYQFIKSQYDLYPAYVIVETQFPMCQNNVSRVSCQKGPICHA